MSKHDDRCLNANRQPERHQSVDYSKWILRLLTWDGLAPVMMLSLPFLIRRFGPANNDRFLVMSIVAALIAGILLRFSFGMRHIRANYCRAGVKRFQQAGLLAMIAVLVLVETLLCLIPAAGFKGADLMFFSVVALGYLLVMSCVLYPSRPK